MLDSNCYALILAGGEGTRFTPLSTPQKPKQFLSILHPELTLLQQTLSRISGLVPDSHVFISTNDRYVPVVAEQTGFASSQILGEPFKRNTAPPIALATRLIYDFDPKAVILFLPSDHFIQDPIQAQTCWKKGLDLAASEPCLVTFGLPPTFASSEYGYLKTALQQGNSQVIEQFVEKPSVEVASKYLKAGNYFWNGGMFAWKASVFLKTLEETMPELARLLQNLPKTPDEIRNYFEKAPSVSIDYGVMEKTKTPIRMIKFDTGWSDVGTWESLKHVAEAYKIELPATVKSYLSQIKIQSGSK